MSTTGNPYNSTVVQGLIEAIKTGAIDATRGKMVIDELVSNAGATAAADKAVARKSYAPGSLTFARWPRLDVCDSWLHIPAGALRLLIYMIAHMSTACLCLLNRQYCADMLGISGRQIKRYIADLLADNHIAVYRGKHGKVKPVYMINPRLGSVSKTDTTYLLDRFWRLCGAATDTDARNLDAEYLSHRWTNRVISTVRIPRGNDTVPAGTIVDIADDTPPRQAKRGSKKKSSPAAATSAESTESDDSVVISDTRESIMISETRQADQLDGQLEIVSGSDD